MSWLSCPAVSYISVFGMLWLCRFYWHWLSVPTLCIEVLSYKFLGEQRILFLMFPAWSRIERADGSQSSLRMILSPHTHRIVWALNNDSPNNVGLEQDLDPPKDSQVFIVAVPFLCIYIYIHLNFFDTLIWPGPCPFCFCHVFRREIGWNWAARAIHGRKAVTKSRIAEDGQENWCSPLS